MLDSTPTYGFGMAVDVPVTGDWNRDGRTEIGMVRNGRGWFLDSNGNGVWDAGDSAYGFGLAGDVPVTGDWNNDGKTEIGVFRNGHGWYLDSSGNGAWGAGDTSYGFGLAGDVPVTGDWNNDGKTEIGVYRNGHYWYLDGSGNGAWGAGDIMYDSFGQTGDKPVSGKWPAQKAFRIYAEGVRYYYGTQLDLPYADTIASNFYNDMDGKCGAASWDPSIRWSGSGLKINDDAGSKHWNYFEQASSYSDNADFAIFVGHGDNDGIYFGTPNTELSLHRADMNFGGNRLKWVTLQSCSALEQDTHTNWETVFNGVHIINGYDTLGNLEATQGGKYAQMLTRDGYPPMTIRTAWQQMLKETLHSATYRGAWKWAEPCKDDYLPGFGAYCPAPTKNTYGQYDIRYDIFDCSL